MSETITRNNPTNLLLAPGPVPIPAFVAQSLAKPVIHHRGPAFAAVMQALRAGLQHLLQTQGATGLMIGSGTFGIETGMYSLFRPGERVLIVDNGKFSERWGEYGEVIGLENVLLKKNWGEVPSPEEVVAAATEGKPVSGVVITHCETSTGALTDLESVAVALRQALPDVLILVDAITSAGAVPFYLDDWDIDAAVVASQKALMNPAGIICWGLSERAVARLRPTRPGDFANWFNYHEAAKKDSFPFTPPIQGMYGILAALDHIREEGLPAIWNRVHHSSKLFKTGIKKAGGRVIGKSPSDSLTAFDWPNGDLPAIRQRLLDHGFELAGGQGEWKNKILRMSHMGTSADEQIVKAVLEVIGK